MSPSRPTAAMSSCAKALSVSLTHISITLVFLLDHFHETDKKAKDIRVGILLDAKPVPLRLYFQINPVDQISHNASPVSCPALLISRQQSYVILSDFAVFKIIPTTTHIRYAADSFIITMSRNDIIICLFPVYEWTFALIHLVYHLVLL